MALLTAINQSMTAITALPSAVAKGGLVLLETQTASSDGTLDFTSNIDSTYKEYVFKFYDIHPSSNDGIFSFQADTGTNTSYNQTITSTFIAAYHNEGDTDTALGYQASSDLAQATTFHRLIESGNGNDESAAGTLHVFDPSSTTFVKHFIGSGQCYQRSDYSQAHYYAGYFNTATALTRFQFKMSTGNIDAGTIKMYGVT